MIYKNVTSGFRLMGTLNLLALAAEPAQFKFLRGNSVIKTAGYPSNRDDVSQAYGRISRR